jgi:hypothetical protein
MAGRFFLVAVFLAAVGLRGVDAARAQEPLDAEAIRAALKTTVIEEDNYISFLVTLVNQSRLPRVVFDTSYRWVQRKGYLRFQFFKRAVIAQAERAGISLPQQTPPLRQDIEGKVVQRILLVDVPVPMVDVQLVGTNHKTKTDLGGRFHFTDLPWDVYTVEVHGGAAQLFRKISRQVKLPYLPNDPTTLTLSFR